MQIRKDFGVTSLNSYPHYGNSLTCDCFLNTQVLEKISRYESDFYEETISFDIGGYSLNSKILTTRTPYYDHCVYMPIYIQKENPTGLKIHEIYVNME